MSSPNNQPWRDPEEYEREYHRDLLLESLTISRNRKKQALELRSTAIKCLDKGTISFTDYVAICQRNSVPIF